MADRVDASGKAYAGSQLQTQLYVNEHPKELNRALASEFQELAGATIRWQSPLKAEGYREYQDEEFLDRIGLRHHATKLKDFWPSGGPVWDALAQVDRREGPGVILVEGKS